MFEKRFKRMRRQLQFLWIAALACLAPLAIPLSTQATSPNIIHIFADDLGYGSVGFNGQTKIATPNLDALAAAGLRFQNAYSCPTCAAARATLLTGFNTGHSNVDGNSEISSGFNADEVMTGSVLKQAGYNTAIFGKWGFGATGSRSLTGSDPVPTINGPNSLPNNHGFDTFYGYLDHGAAQDYFYDYMWQTQTGAPNGVATVLNNGGAGGAPQYTHDLIAAKSEQYVTAHAADSQPFYMQVNYTIPHYDIDQISSVPGGLGIYASMPWTTQQKEYAAMITRMDSSIGSLVAKLSNPDGNANTNDGILNNTLIVFSSDNGASTEDGAPRDFFSANGVFRGGKFEIYEGGIHMPQLAYWNGTIAPSSSTSYRTDLADFTATAADLAGVDAPVGIDGTSLAPILTGQGHLKQRDYLVFEQHGVHGDDADPRIGRWTVIRQDGMKLIRYDNETQELYNLNTDPDENSPLNLSNPTNLAIAQELEADAIADDVARGTVQYRTWSGPSGGNLQTASSWAAPTSPDRYWSAVIANNTAAPKMALVASDVTILGVEVKGATAQQVVEVKAFQTLAGVNEVRVGNHGRIDLAGGTVASNRWVNVKTGGQIVGKGTIVGDVYNEGTIAPGRNNDSPAWPIAAPAALPPSNLNTSISTAVSFNFSGIQDDVAINQTSTLSPYLQLSNGLDYGPSVGPRWGGGGTNAGNELNLIGHNATSLAAAITNGDYITYTVNPVAGAGILPDTVSFNLWRNGGAAAKNFAILTNVGGFTTGAAVAQAIYTDTGSTSNQHTFSATIPALADALAGPIEVRLYAWNATAATGNTHITAASMTAKFISVPTIEFNFTGVQDGAPLTALKRQDANAVLTSGLNFGSGVVPAVTDNVGNEFHVAGFSTGSDLQSAIDNNDYLTFTVQPVAGMVMYTDSVSFSLWRQSSSSATNYAVMSSVAGFTPGQQIASAQLVTTGAANTLALGGPMIDSQPTANPVEFRLYGWNATSALDSTHVVAASMRARFASVSGAIVDPTGAIAVQGDFYHLAGANLVIDVAGIASGVNYDALNVTGKIDLAGNLMVNLADTSNGIFAPLLGDSFSILTAAQGITGNFANVALPVLAWNLDWRLDYLGNAVNLIVWTSGDFNHDGLVDTADYVIWRKNDGTQAEFDTWRSRYGLAGGIGAGLGSASAAVPEPSIAALFVIYAIAMLLPRSRCAI
jgi:arylsulfatase A-like enzyme